MKYPDDFDFWVEDDRIEVRFVAQKELGRISEEGHAVGGDYEDGVIRLPRYELRTTNRSAILHELGHYLVARQEIRVKNAKVKATEEDVCDLLTWLPVVYEDRRNEEFRQFMGLCLSSYPTTDRPSESSRHEAVQRI